MKSVYVKSACVLVDVNIHVSPRKNQYVDDSKSTGSGIFFFNISVPFTFPTKNTFRNTSGFKDSQ